MGRCQGERAAENTSMKPFVSFDVRFVADESKTRNENAALLGLPLKRRPELPTEPLACCAPSSSTRAVCPALRTRTKTSAWPFVSPLTRFDAYDTNATASPL